MTVSFNGDQIVYSFESRKRAWEKTLASCVLKDNRKEILPIASAPNASLLQKIKAIVSRIFFGEKYRYQIFLKPEISGLNKLESLNIINSEEKMQIIQQIFPTTQALKKTKQALLEDFPFTGELVVLDNTYRPFLISKIQDGVYSVQVSTNAYNMSILDICRKFSKLVKCSSLFYNDTSIEKTYLPCPQISFSVSQQEINAFVTQLGEDNLNLLPQEAITQLQNFINRS